MNQHMGAENVRNQRPIRVFTAQGREHGVLYQGRPIAYSAEPVLILERADGTHQTAVCSLPWEYADEDAAAGNVAADAMDQLRAALGDPADDWRYDDRNLRARIRAILDPPETP